jgi:hypothetical protein
MMTSPAQCIQHSVDMWQCVIFRSESPLLALSTTNNREVSHQYEYDNDNEHVINIFSKWREMTSWFVRTYPQSDDVFVVVIVFVPVRNVICLTARFFIFNTRGSTTPLISCLHVRQYFALIWGRCSGEKLAADRNRRVFDMIIIAMNLSFQMTPDDVNRVSHDWVITVSPNDPKRNMIEALIVSRDSRGIQLWFDTTHTEVGDDVIWYTLYKVHLRRYFRYL